jgi:arylsulfatase A-like enzyme/Tfp pilus assembly protein PilF
MSRRVLATIGTVALVIALFAWWRSGDRDLAATPPTANASRPRNVLLVTIDTLRADRVGAYGWEAARTPAMDALAGRGVRFDQAFATAPITLTSHASLLTGLYPPGHGARHNGVRAGTAPATLATALAARGFATGAFVAAFPLDRRFGLHRGFEVYSDVMPRGSDGRLRHERPGSVVVDEALAWLAARAGGPFFLWVHLFEPHAPYEPDPSRGAGGAAATPADRYDDEVARADVEVGRLLAALSPSQDTTLVIVASDHGEAFGEHDEYGHSLFVYDTTLRVPLIMAGPGVPAGRAVTAPVSLVDVVPTVLDLLGEPPLEVDGISLVAAMRGEPTPSRALFAESFAPLLDFGWSSLRSVRREGMKFIAAPTPELYDLAADPGETRNVLASRSAEGTDLGALAERYSAAEFSGASDKEAPSAADAEARRRLEALGYVSGGRSAGGAAIPRPDPKDRKALASRIALVASGELAGAALRSALEGIVREDPGNGQAHMRLGFVLLEAGDCAGAEPHFRAAREARVASADPSLGLAGCLFARGDLGGAQRALEEGDAIEPGNPVVQANLGAVALAQGRVEAALTALRAAIDLAPEFHEARFNLARAYAQAGRREEATREARELLARLPASAPQRAEVERLLAAVG